MKRFRDRIQSINPLSTLGSRQIDDIVDTGEFIEMARGTQVFVKGEDDEFAYYLMEGELELTDNRCPSMDVSSSRAKYAIGNLRPRPFTCTVNSNHACVLRLGREDVEEWVARSQMLAVEMQGVAVSDLSEPQGLDNGWMFQMIQSEIFKVLPTENIERFFLAVERQEFKAGEVIIREGDRGDFYYMIENGNCEISRESDGKSSVIAELGPGGAFGEEALISEEPRNATATMKTGGILMRLSKEEFTDLLAHPVIQSISASSARTAIEQRKALLLDVRTEGEHEDNSVPESLNLPLDHLRVRASELDPRKMYVTYCDMEARSLSAAFLLRERGFRAAYLEGGMSSLLALAE
jgi:CRP-like cAMP-binding protein